MVFLFFFSFSFLGHRQEGRSRNPGAVAGNRMSTNNAHVMKWESQGYENKSQAYRVVSWIILVLVSWRTKVRLDNRSHGWTASRGRVLASTGGVLGDVDGKGQGRSDQASHARG